MKIIKAFDDNQYARSISQFWTQKTPYLVWGLGDDGELYCKCCMVGAVYEKWAKPEFYIPLRQMKKIIAKFDHLLPFI